MLQQVIVGVLFISAVGYVARLVHRSLRAKSSCEAGCGKCGAIDFEKIEAKIRNEGLQKY